jgi:hypothetical protein
MPAGPPAAWRRSRTGYVRRNADRSRPAADGEAGVERRSMPIRQRGTLATRRSSCCREVSQLQNNVPALIEADQVDLLTTPPRAWA